jgi:hypothetical protein
VLELEACSTTTALPIIFEKCGTLLSC